MSKSQGTISFALLAMILLIVCSMQPLNGCGQTTATEGIARDDKEAFIALSISEEYHYALSGNMFNLWLMKKEECDMLNQKIKLFETNANVQAEELAMLRMRLSSCTNQLNELEEALKKAQRKAKRKAVWSGVGSGLSLALGIFLGINLSVLR